METEEVRKFLSNVDCINYGGCLISAFAFYLHEKKMGRADNLEIVALPSSAYSKYYKTNKAFIGGERKTATSDGHFGWTYDNGKTVFDCEKQCHVPETILIVPKHLTEKFCVNSLNNGDWNTDFERKVHLPKIAKKLGIDLSKVWVERKCFSTGTFRKNLKQSFGNT